jgi:hypothetical protein
MTLTLLLVDRIEEMLGSYAPGQNNEKKLPLEEAPSGVLFRGTYTARSSFVDDDKHTHLDFNWSFEVIPLRYSHAKTLIDQEELGVVRESRIISVAETLSAHLKYLLISMPLMICK